METEDGDKETGDRHRQEADSKDHDRPSRPNSRDSRVSKESRGSKGNIKLFFKGISDYCYF